MLSQLSGLIPPSQPRVSTLFSVYKEIEKDLTLEENKKVLRLFGETKKKENMYSEQKQWSHTLDYYPRIEILNVVEIYLRKLLGKYGYYEITKEEVDYQLGEF